MPWVSAGWGALRYDERREVDKKKVHRLWREEGLQARVHSPRKRAGVSSIRPVEADAPKVVWAIDFQFDSIVDGKAVKIASMIDEHTRESLVNIVERSITAERLIAELEKCFAAAIILRRQGGVILYPPWIAVGKRLHRIVQQPATKGVPQPQPLDKSARGSCRHRRFQPRT
jgi:hypothetical protein